MIAKWKSEFLERMSIVFKASDEKESEDNLDTRELFVQIGQLKVENEYLKKNLKKLGINM
jgi:predicted nucleotidyltransferase